MEVFRVFVVLSASILFFDCIERTNGARILALAPVASMSHYGFLKSNVNAFAKGEHQVTFVSPFSSKTHPNIREVLVPEGKLDTAVLKADFLSDEAPNPLVNLFSFMPYFCLSVLKLPQVQELLKEEFDLVLLTTMNDCFLTIPYQLKAPHISVIPAGLIGGMDKMIANPNFASYMPHLAGSFSNEMTFPQRIGNALMQTAMSIVFEGLYIPRVESLVRSHGLHPADAPSFNEIRYNVSFVILNAVRTTEFPQAYMPNVIHAGGIHCSPAQPLPQDLEEFVQGSGEHGFIFFSLGSAIKASMMHEDKRKVLVKVFGSLKQRVLWKWETEEMPDLPPNVRLSKWLPQQDLLGHPKIRLFFSHGGLNSILETTYHGVPVLGIPICNDQRGNLNRVVAERGGQILEWSELNEETLKKTIITMISDTSRKEFLIERSAIMKDTLLRPEDEVNYWVGYTLRHNGAHHLKTPARFFPLWKLYNFDVWVTILGITAFVIYILAKLVGFCCRSLCSKSKTKVE